MVERGSSAAGESSETTNCSIRGLVDDSEDGRDAIIHGGKNAVERSGL